MKDLHGFSAPGAMGRAIVRLLDEAASRSERSSGKKTLPTAQCPAMSRWSRPILFTDAER